MQSVLFSFVMGSALLMADPADKPASVGSLDAAVDSYEHLAIVLVDVRKTEDMLVKSIIAHHYQAAQEHLQAAQGGKDVLKHLEAAATEATNVANEGDKRVLAIRQRLAMAGSTHKTDKETKEDYLWIDSKEKKAILDAAKSIAQLGDKATGEQVAAASKSLYTLYNKAVAPE